jgi:polysaccharide export outer membrane protein
MDYALFLRQYSHVIAINFNPNLMKTRVKSFFPSLIIVLFISSCISQKKLEYLQDPVETQKTYPLQDSKENIIKPNDELYITVTSIDDPVFNFLGGQSDYLRAGYSTDLSISLISYTVQQDGNIQFPILGKVKLGGLTIDQARENLEDRLQGYLNQPSVKIKFAYKKVTLIGEVSRPGNYTYSKDQINILEAISIGGDITVHGNLSEVYLMRKTDNNITKYKVDLTRDDLVFTEYFNMQPDDIIYVKPRRSLKWNVISVPITLILSTITTSLLIINYFQ